MNRPIPPALRREIESFVRLMLDKGDPAAMRHILKLKKALDCDSPVLASHVNTVTKNAVTPQYAPDMTEDERYIIGELLLQIEAWQEGKPGPPKAFPIRLDLRMSDEEQDALNAIGEKTGENRSDIIRRLVREAAKE